MKFVAACLKFCRDSRSESRQEFRFPPPILLRFPASLHQDFGGCTFASARIFAKFAVRSWQLCQLPAFLYNPEESWRDLCQDHANKFWSTDFLLPGKNLDKIRSRIPARFLPSGFLLPGENPDEICCRITLRFWPLDFCFPARILARFEIGSQRDFGRWDFCFPVRILMTIMAGSRQDFGRGILASREESWQDLQVGFFASWQESWQDLR